MADRKTVIYYSNKNISIGAIIVFITLKESFKIMLHSKNIFFRIRFDNIFFIYIRFKSCLRNYLNVSVNTTDSSKLPTFILRLILVDRLAGTSSVLNHWQVLLAPATISIVN